MKGEETMSQTLQQIMTMMEDTWRQNEERIEES